MKKNKYEIDMCNGSIMDKLISFSLPLMLSGILQLMFNAVDIVVVGRFSGSQALAAVGSTTALINIFTNLFIGISLGANVLAARFYASGKEKEMSETVHTAITLALISGIIMAGVGLLLAKLALELMGTPSDVIELSTLYMRIYFCGMPFFMLYNYGAAILRAVGDTKRPLIFLIISGVINIILDIVFVICLGTGVVGCGYATVIAQGISAVLCFIYILKKFPILHLKKEDFEFSGELCRRLLTLGVPMALQFSITSIGTIIVQAAINVYGATCIAGFAAGGKIQSVMGVIFISYGAAMATYVGQNCGAGRMDRVRQGVRSTQIMVLIWSFVLMALVLLFGKYAIYLFVDRTETDVVEAALTYFKAVAWCYPFLGSIFIYRNALQGMGYGLVPMLGGVFELVARTIIVISVAGKASYFGVCLSDPAAWIAALIPLIPYYIYIMRKV